MASENLRHFFLDRTGDAVNYTSKQSGGEKPAYPERDRRDHGETIRRKLEEAWRQAKAIDEQRKAVALSTKDGIYLEFESSPGYELATKSLEQLRSGIRLANIRTEIVAGKEVRKATVFIPSKKEVLFLRKVQAYLEEETGKKKPKNQGLIESVNDIKLAVMAESFWQGKKDWIPRDIPAWCEIWLSTDSEEMGRRHGS